MGLELGGIFRARDAGVRDMLSPPDLSASKPS